MKRIASVTNRQLEKDVKTFLEIYPSFSYDKRHGKRYSPLKGDIDVCDKAGNYLESFDVEMWLDNDKYPYSIPLIREHSAKIKRHEDWHIDKEGYCCLDIEHELEYKAKKGIELVSFYQNDIYPYFANTVYKMNFGRYANGEYGHSFKGIEQFYNEKFQLNNYTLIIKILEAVLNNKVPGRNDRPCICGLDKKFKRCHLRCVNFLQSLSKERLLKDLAGFEELAGKHKKAKSRGRGALLFP